MVLKSHYPLISALISLTSCIYNWHILITQIPIPWRWGGPHDRAAIGLEPSTPRTNARGSRCERLNHSVTRPLTSDSNLDQCEFNARSNKVTFSNTNIFPKHAWHGQFYHRIPKKNFLVWAIRNAKNRI